MSEIIKVTSFLNMSSSYLGFYRAEPDPQRMKGRDRASD
jgi:hypothetical protein